MITVHLYSPTNSETGVGIWDSCDFIVSGGYGSTIELYLNGALNKTVYNDSFTGFGYIFPAAPLSYSTAYSWYVKVYEPGQGFVQSVETWSFTTAAEGIRFS